MFNAAPGNIMNICIIKHTEQKRNLWNLLNAS